MSRIECLDDHTGGADCRGAIEYRHPPTKVVWYLNIWTEKKEKKDNA